MSGWPVRGGDPGSWFTGREAPSEQEMTQPEDRLQPLLSSLRTLSSGLSLQTGLEKRVDNRGYSGQKGNRDTAATTATCTFLVTSGEVIFRTDRNERSQAVLQILPLHWYRRLLSELTGLCPEV